MTARRWGSGLVVAEVALALILLIGSGLLLRSYGLLQGSDPGFKHRDRLMFSTWLLDERYSSLEVRRQFADDVRNRLQAHPGIRSVAFSSLIPLSGDDNIWGVRFADEPGTARDEEQFCVVYRVSPGYFNAMGIPLVSGHDFTSADGPDTRPVALLSESIARQHFGDEEPEGRRFIMGDETYTVIGVVGDVQHYSLGQASPRPQVYLLYAQNVVRSVSFVLHASVPPQTLAQTARDAVLAVDPDQPVVELQTLDQLVSSTIAGARFRTLLLACFAGVALVLAVVGLYGIMSFAVSQRTHEIGVRVALGAHAGSVIGLIIRNGMSLVLIGTVLGLIAAGTLAGLLETFLFGIGVRDPGIFVGAPLVLIVTALLATLVPARRATRVDPIRALVQE
jgi:predicted permease